MVRVGDADAVRKFLAPLPDANVIDDLIRSDFFVQIWQTETGEDIWIASDGMVALSITITGLTLKEASSVRKKFNRLEDQAFNLERIVRLVSHVVGGNITIAHQ